MTTTTLMSWTALFTVIPCKQSGFKDAVGGFRNHGRTLPAHFPHPSRPTVLRQSQQGEVPPEPTMVRVRVSGH